MAASKFGNTGHVETVLIPFDDHSKFTLGRFFHCGHGDRKREICKFTDFPFPILKNFHADLLLLPLGSRTVAAYLAAVRQLGQFHQKSPDLVCVEELRQYFLQLKCVKKVARQTSTQALCAIKLFWEDRCRTLFREKLQARAPESFGSIPVKVWKQRWRADCQAVGSGENALRYLSRYVFKTATANRLLPTLPDGRVRWPYRHSRTGAQTHVDLAPQELVRRFLEHVLPKHLARVRAFGWFHPAARAGLNRVRALLGQRAVLTQAEQQAWLQQAPATPEVSRPGSATPYVPRCPQCERPMQIVARWRAGTPPPNFTELRRRLQARAPP